MRAKFCAHYQLLNLTVWFQGLLVVKSCTQCNFLLQKNEPNKTLANYRAEMSPARVSGTKNNSPFPILPRIPLFPAFTPAAAPGGQTENAGIVWTGSKQERGREEGEGAGDVGHKSCTLCEAEILQDQLIGRVREMPLRLGAKCSEIWAWLLWNMTLKVCNFSSNASRYIYNDDKEIPMFEAAPSIPILIGK